VKRDGQLMLDLSSPHQMQSLPEPNRSQCIALLGRMLLSVIEASHPEEEPVPNQTIQRQPLTRKSPKNTVTVPPTSTSGSRPSSRCSTTWRATGGNMLWRSARRR